MLRSMKDLVDYVIKAQDGEIGRCRDFLFDDAEWTVRYMVADTRRWIPGRKVLIPPHALGKAEWGADLFNVRLSKQQIKSSPGLETDEPVSREREREIALHFGWDPYWVRTGFPGAASIPPIGTTRPEKDATASVVEEEMSNAGELRSMEEVAGYHVEANDGEIGHVEDFIIDDDTWTVRYVVVDTRNILPGKKVLIAPRWVDTINWPGQRIRVDQPRERIRNAPAYNPGAPVNREQETRLYDYYGRPAYWL